jgi:hypothetical protein
MRNIVSNRLTVCKIYVHYTDEAIVFYANWQLELLVNINLSDPCGLNFTTRIHKGVTKFTMKKYYLASFFS